MGPEFIRMLDEPLVVLELPASIVVGSGKRTWNPVHTILSAYWSLQASLCNCMDNFSPWTYSETTFQACSEEQIQIPLLIICDLLYH